MTVSVRPAALLETVLMPGATEDPWMRTFLKLRELPDRALRALGARSEARPHVSFGIDHFMRLGSDPGRELVLGLAGRFWQPDYGLVAIDEPTSRYLNYTEPNLAKLVLNFRAEPLPDGRTCLTTETRVFCVDAAALNHFRPYWILIRPISGLIRRRLLARIGRLAAVS